MSAKTDRQKLRTAKKLVRELKQNTRGLGFLGRLCRWEQSRRRTGLFTLQHRQD